MNRREKTLAEIGDISARLSGLWRSYLALLDENDRMKAVVDAATELERIYTNTSYVSDDELLVALEQPLENLFARLMIPDPSP